MATNDGQGILYTFTGDVRGYKARIAAQYSGVPLTVADSERFQMGVTNRSEEYLRKFPTGKVPAYENDAGVYLFESNAIAHYLSNEQLRGETPAEQSQIVQWTQYGEREIHPVSATLVYPCLGMMPFNKNNHEHAKEQLQGVLRILDQSLSSRTSLVGAHTTLADISIACDLLLLFQWILEPNVRNTYPSVTRWFTALIDQKEFRAILGPDYQLCEKAAQFDGKKYAEMSRQNQASTIKTVNEPPKEKTKAKKETKQPEAVVPEEDEADDIYDAEPKQNDPFANVPKSTMNMDEFKRVYSNEDTATKALPYFWTNFDRVNCSIWFCEYKYPEELTQVFMTCNLITGFFQRLDKLRKNAFGSMCVFGEANNNTIAGVWFWRGQGLAFELEADWQLDYESYTWKRLSIDDENTKTLVSQYFLWEGEHNGKKFSQGKVFK